MNTRTQALARQDADIQNNVANIEATKAKPSAIQILASRLDITPGRLQETLLNTVFKGATEHEFAALVVVANELDLNPMKKEIYAFPSRGGITPMIGYDGWLSIVNRHPQFDGYEHNEIFDGDKFIGVESIFYRKDRSLPVKKAVYLDEFKMNTDPWKQKPRHMCQMRSFCQGARIAFGITGVMVEDDFATVDVTSYDAGPVSVPPSRQLRQEQEQQQSAPGPEAYDRDSGEIIDDQEADAAAEREADRMLNGDQDEDQDTGNDVEAALNDEPRWKMHYRHTLDNIMAAQNVSNLNALERDFVNHRVTYDAEAVGVVEREIANARKRLTP